MALACEKIMLIRHAERPSPDKTFRGVDIAGRKDKESLTVRGWQRAGALVRFFAPLGDEFAHEALACPKTLHACKADGSDPSLRPQLTLVPLSELLDVELQCGYFRGEEDALVSHVLAGDGPALISWKHDGMHLIANAILGDDRVAPQGWPYERYDLVWAFMRGAGVGSGWSFFQIPQLLLAGDSREPIRQPSPERRS